MYLLTAPTTSAATSVTASRDTRETATTVKVRNCFTFSRNWKVFFTSILSVQRYIWVIATLDNGAPDQIFPIKFIAAAQYTPNLDVKTVGVKNRIWTVKPNV